MYEVRGPNRSKWTISINNQNNMVQQLLLSGLLRKRRLDWSAEFREKRGELFYDGGGDRGNNKTFFEILFLNKFLCGELFLPLMLIVRNCYLVAFSSIVHFLRMINQNSMLLWYLLKYNLFYHGIFDFLCLLEYF